MRRLWLMILIALVAATPASAVLPGEAPSAGGANPSFEEVLAKRCGFCHTRERIEQARRRGDMAEAVLQRMAGQGVSLSSDERSTLTAFWGNPLREPAPASAAEGLSAYLKIIETRCLQCHTRERIDAAIVRQLPWQPLEALLARRGVTLTPGESEVLRAFWGEPLR